MEKSWYSITAKAGETPEITIYEEIGIWGISADQFRREFKALGLKAGDPVDLRLNTPGGEVFSGNAIYNTISDSGADVTVYVDGVAASMGSLIAMTGRVVMASNAQMMIHNPAAFAAGGSKDMSRMARLLDSLKVGMVRAYVNKSGLSEEEVSSMMEDETWMTAEDAVAFGFADSIGPGMQVHAVDVTRFKHPPRIEAFTKGRRKPAATKESDMDKNEVEGIVNAALKPITDAIAALKPPAAPEAKVTAETPEQIAARVNAERDAYEGEIHALCEDFGNPTAAAAFIKDKKTATDVRAALRLERDKKAKPSGPAARNHVNETGKPADDAEDHSDLVVTALDHGGIWNRYNKKAGAIQKVVPAAD